ncbi:MAG TPA: alpha/beta hydrolase-fold protein, partial [Longimicrobiaceae bacterium]|nr:alpha/beta hydrolase-fold protein [Longimicrobiaceae bacterium]
LRLTSVPASTPAGAPIFVAGSFNRWNPADSAYRLMRDASGEYALTLPEAVRGPVEFKFTLGGWERGELNASGGGVPNRRFTVPDAGPATYTGVVEAWQDPAKLPPKTHTASPSVSVVREDFAIPQLGRMRRVWVYLPPGYAASRERYPVLYMHDGQNLFDAFYGFSGEWGVDESLDSLHARGDRGVIVVAVDNGESHRLDEYSPWKNARYGGGEGDAYLDFLVHTLKPYVDNQYRTRPGRLDTGIAGSSMGGLISLYAILKYPDVFGRAGVFSPALWFAPEVYAYARHAAPPLPGTRIYFVTGGREGDTPEVYSGDQRRMIDTLALAGFRVGVQVDSAIRADGMHAEWFWRREFPAVYRWLFAERAGDAGRAAEPRRPVPVPARRPAVVCGALRSAGPVKSASHPPSRGAPCAG